MKLEITGELNYTWPRILQSAGYHEHAGGYVKRLGGDYYPRWHVYLSAEEKGHLLFNLHLDQRPGVHQGITAHAGEYEGELVQAEAERLLSIFNNNKLV
jgi:hypothetical protein